MAPRKTKKKELTTEEKLALEKERCLAEIGTEYSLIYAPEPTYYFNVGDEVRYGGLKKAVVEEVHNDGKVYLLRCVAINNNYGNPFEYETYRIVAWHQIRQFTAAASSEYEFAKNRNVRLNFNNTTIESLIHKYYYFGIDMEPDYQRDFVWNDNDRELLIKSVFENIDIGKFVLIILDNEEWNKRNVGYEILDGKQRLSTLIAFYENRFSYRGKYFNDLCAMDRHVFMNHNIVTAEVKEASKKEVYNYFLMLNQTGKVMDQNCLKNIEKLIESIE